MKNKMLALCFLLTICNLYLYSNNGDYYIFRLQLSDKDTLKYSIAEPESYLSKRSIDRRKMQNIDVDIKDYPISELYLKTIENLGYNIVAKSKWLNTVCIYTSDSLNIENFKNIDFIEKVDFVWKSKNDSLNKEKSSRKKIKIPQHKAINNYGYGYDQIRLLNGEELHKKGYKGEGIEIAIIDAGFKNLKEILLLDNIKIKGHKNFVYNGEDMFTSSSHGLNVLSILATNIPKTYIGTAPKANYWLLRSEDGRSEYPIEEDYWIAATEYADSVGINIINTSLGYTRFDAPAKSYTKENLDGQTSNMSKVAQIAADKGIFMNISAGNEGGSSWGVISVPGDVKDVLTVGSIKRNYTLSDFSSIGLENLGYTKPDVVALGDEINVINENGDITPSSGTSFSGPVMTGMAACLWQAYPTLTNKELLDIIRKSANKYDKPSIYYGYGMPDMEKAMKIAEEYLKEKKNIID